jgi:large subunit ribosomal protein L18
VARLTVNRTNLHIYATVISDDGSKVLASASTAADRPAQGARRLGQGRQCRRRPAGGQADRRAAKAAGVEKVAFDRSGFAYHGRVKALAEAAREAGLQF